MPTDFIVAAHAETIRMGMREVVEQLNRHLGASLVATLAGVSDRKLPYRWARKDGSLPGREARSRLTAAYRIWVQLAGAESDDIARAWFLGANPYLDEHPPIMVLRDGETRSTLLAAQAFLDGAGRR